MRFQEKKRREIFSPKVSRRRERERERERERRVHLVFIGYAAAAHTSRYGREDVSEPKG